SALRAILWQRYRGNQPTIVDANNWAWRFTGVTSLSACLWGVAVLVMWPAASTTDRLTLILAVTAVTAAESAALASYMPAVLARLGMTVAALLGALLWHGEINGVMAAWAVFFTLTLAIGAKHLNRQLTESLRLRLDLAEAGSAAQA